MSKKIDRKAEEEAKIAKWDERYLGLAAHIRNWSKDPRGKIGAVITSPRLGRIISVGFNGFPIKIDDDVNRLADKQTKLDMMIHAEQNALLFAGRSARKCHLYVVGKPICNYCAALIIQAGITRVIAEQPDENDTASQWAKRGVIALNLFKEAKVEFSPIPNGKLEELLSRDYWVTPEEFDESGNLCE